MMEKIIRRIIFFVLSTFILYSLWYIISALYNKNKNSETTFFSVVENLIAPRRSTKKNNITLQEIIDEVSQNTDTTMGIVVKHLNTGEQSGINTQEEFESASLYKLWVMAAVFDRIEKGILSEDTVLSQDVIVLNQEFYIPTESAELTEGTITATVADALEQMITVSDNYSALLLSEKISNSTIQQFLIDNGFANSKLGVPPTTTPSDIALFFEKLYTGQLTNEVYSHKMIDLLKRQQLNTKLPKYLPDGTVIAHKTGELGSVSHDAGIVFSPTGDYSIVVMTDSEVPFKTEETIAQLSKSVYTYFNGSR